MAALGGVAISAVASNSAKVKNVAKKSTTKPPGFTRNLLRNGSFDSSNAPSPCSNGSSDSQRGSPAVMEINGKMSPTEDTQASVGNGEDHNSCSSDSFQKGEPLTGGALASHALVAEQSEVGKGMPENVPEVVTVKDNSFVSDGQSLTETRAKSSNANSCFSSNTHSLSEQSQVSSQKCLNNVQTSPTKTDPFDSNTKHANDEKENKTDIIENSNSNLNSENSYHETDPKCDLDAMDSNTSNSGSSTRNVLSLSNVKDSFKGIIKKAVSKVSSRSNTPLPDPAVEAICASPDSITNKVEKGNSVEGLNNGAKPASPPSTVEKDKDEVTSVKGDDTMDKLEKEMEIELENMEPGNLDDVDDSILDESFENIDTKACDTEEIKMEKTGVKENICTTSENGEEKSDEQESKDNQLNCKVEDSNINKLDETVANIKSEAELASLENDSVKKKGVEHTESRKRAASPDGLTGEGKKSRLDNVVGRLGTQIGVKPDNASSDEVVTSPENAAVSVAVTRSETAVKESDNSKDSTLNENHKDIKISKKRLDKIIAERLSAYLNSKQDSLVSKLQRRINELGSDNEAWKAQVLELKKQIIDITVIHQRHERRRTLPARVQSRNMSIQVDETKIQAATQGLVQHVTPSGAKVTPTVQPNPPQTSGGPGIPLARGVQVSHPSSLPHSAPQVTPQTMLIPVASTGGVVPGQAVTLLAPSSLPPASANLGSQIRMLAAPSIGEPVKSSSNQTVREMLEQKKKSPVAPALTTTSNTAGHSLLTKPAGSSVIDLTGDDDSAAKARGAIVPTGLPPGMNLPPGVIRPGLSITGLQPGTFVLRQASAGAPMILQPISSTQVRNATPGTTVLYTTRPTAPMVASGPALTSAARMSAPLPTFSSSSQAQSVAQGLRSPPPNARSTLKHPAPLPTMGIQKNIAGKSLPPKPTLKINRVQQGIVLSWNMTVSEGLSDVTNYQLFAYQEGAAAPTAALWKKVGDVKALPLPMACTLTQFQVGNKYHFAVRAADSYGRTGPFSDPGSIHLEKR